MQFKPSKPVQWIADIRALERSLPALMAVPILAVDTESNSLYAYREQVCLIQFSTAEQDYLVDGLAGLDLSPLGQIFNNPEIEKVFHAAEYDVICLRRDFGFQFRNVFDTMQAARILGFDKIGLSTLLENQFRVEPVKSFQKANWGKRPLTDEMIQYARLDTHYLIPLRDRMDSQLKKKGLGTLAQEDFERVCRAKNNENHASLYTHIRGFHYLTPSQLSVLDALCRFRDDTASRLNRPHFKVIGGKALYALAEASPSTLGELKQVEGLSPRLAERYGRGLIAAVKRGLNAPVIILPAHKRPSRRYVDRLESLKKWRKEAAKKMSVQSDIVLPRDILEKIASSHPGTEPKLALVMDEVPWRFRKFGSEILEVIK